jgi:hypothetical protein
MASVGWGEGRIERKKEEKKKKKKNEGMGML